MLGFGAAALKRHMEAFSALAGFKHQVGADIVRRFPRVVVGPYKIG